MSDDDQTLRQLLAWRREGRPSALATVVGAWGSSPRPPGSLMAVAADGAFSGSVSGGCVEAAVVDAARDVVSTGAVRLLEFAVADETAWQVGLACGGRLQVLVEPSPDPGLVDRLLHDRPLALVTDLASGRHAAVTADAVDGDLETDASTLALARRALAEDASRRLDVVTAPLFVTAFNPPLRLIVVGAVHIAQVLAPVAAQVGYAVTVVDPRRAFASGERFPGITVDARWPDQALAALAPDSRTAIVTLSHDPKLDDPALIAALGSPAFYIGALGSSATQAKRRQRLREAGFGDDDLARILGPVGLDLGGRTAAEIAVAILAQVIAARHGRLEAGRR
jgi:xanthine dehydrogenase accessory factor